MAWVKLAIECAFVLHLLGVGCVAGLAQSSSDDLAVLKSRIREDLLRNRADATLLYIDATVRGPYVADRAGCARRWLDTQLEDGRWPDIDYSNQRRSSWPVSAHTGRMAVMAMEYAAADNAHRADERLAQGILRAWDWWVAKDLTNSNWYPNQITVPGNLCVVALLLGDRLSAERLEAGLKIIKRAKASSTGANLAEMAMIQIGRGCLTGDATAVEDAFAKVAADMRPRRVDGLQPDHSFRYHGTQLYSGSYGSVYAGKAAFLTWLASGTGFEFAPDKLAFLSSYLLDGQQWMVYRGEFDPGAIGRAVTIDGSPARFVREKLLPGMSLMKAVACPRRSELRKADYSVRFSTDEVTGNRFYWNTLLMVHRSSDYYLSVRMCSDEVANAELCNAEGLRTHYVADGATIIRRAGDEYSHIYPVWDWRRIPGITAETKDSAPDGDPRYKGASGFVGGVSDGEIGAAAFDLAHDRLSAKKAWFCFEREMVCLGTDIRCGSGNPVITSVNQCRLRGEVAKGANWVVHDGIGYVFPSGGEYVVRGEKQTGSWRLINGNMPDEPVERDVFSLWLDHGKSPAGAGYEYVVVPRTKVEVMPGYAVSGAIRALRNDSRVQAVRQCRDGDIEAVFRAAESVSLGDGRTLSVDAPCLVIVRGPASCPTITVAGQARVTERPTKVRLSLTGEFSGDGCSCSGGVTSVVFELPQGDLAGSSVTRTLNSHAAR